MSCPVLNATTVVPPPGCGEEPGDQSVSRLVRMGVVRREEAARVYDRGFGGYGQGGGAGPGFGSPLQPSVGGLTPAGGFRAGRSRSVRTSSRGR